MKSRSDSAGSTMARQAISPISTAPPSKTRPRSAYGARFGTLRPVDARVAGVAAGHARGAHRARHGDDGTPVRLLVARPGGPVLSERGNNAPTPPPPSADGQATLRAPLGRNPDPGACQRSSRYRPACRNGRGRTD